MEVFEDHLQHELKRRAPGNLPGTTSRKEPDKPEILAGVYKGKTLGTPIAVIVKNKNQQSQDYQGWEKIERPGHADRTTKLKYGFRDPRGGGRASGRETVSRVIAGYFASLVLPQLKVSSVVSRLGKFHLKQEHKTTDNPYHFPEASTEEIQNYLLNLKNQGESVGGQVSLFINNVPPGLGEPCFDKLKADLAKAFLSLPGVTTFSYGLGEDFADVTGSQCSQEVSYFGGIEGGISNGDEIVLHVTVKPPSTVGEKAKAGRHDPCLIPRIIPVLEAMVKIILADHILRQKVYE